MLMPHESFFLLSPEIDAGAGEKQRYLFLLALPCKMNNGLPFVSD